jgi:hypothetical protein
MFTFKELCRNPFPKIAIFLPIIFLPSSRNQEKGGKKMIGKEIVAADLHALFSPQRVAGMRPAAWHQTRLLPLPAQFINRN